ncbi:cobalamin B12-binding domain-containing protein [Sphingomonas sp. BGYR3]|uniref:cobalamin B12-binding domain-containing protein n=1 Tax=Sphingomonas sp. BGYR3 TaxID=2975483 RepID=UPI0021A2721A|nr:cobalamin B12-binding domain-containing protein [Sphingomonas sp. BGYR3]MDG5487729.1 cobalamin B12-binding domain-containing protein [Sphingomonas sp. BGYR3]
MALVFGLSELKSRLTAWRWDRRSSDRRSGRSAKALPPGYGPEGEDPGISFMIEHQVIPLLVHACYDPGATITAEPEDSGGGDGDGNGAQPPLDADVEPFAQLALKAEAPELVAFVERRLDEGHSVETLFVGLMAPAARLLGEYWENDSRDFLDVTMGLWRIQQALRQLAERTMPPMRSGHGRHSVLMSAMPGDQHGFGTQMVAECFSRAGWNTDLLIQPSSSELHQKLAEFHYDILGLTVSCDCSTATLRNLVTAARSVSRNPDIRILIGGRVVNDHPDLVAACGADGTAADAVSAVATATRLIPNVRKQPDDLI